jgi:hypothetical protein
MDHRLHGTPGPDAELGEEVEVGAELVTQEVPVAISSFILDMAIAGLRPGHVRVHWGCQQGARCEIGREAPRRTLKMVWQR